MNVVWQSGQDLRGFFKHPNKVLNAGDFMLSHAVSHSLEFCKAYLPIKTHLGLGRIVPFCDEGMCHTHGSSNFGSTAIFYGVNFLE